jgi:SAM-dependent methyltransferase
MKRSSIRPGDDVEQITCPACGGDSLAVSQKLSDIVDIDEIIKRWSDCGASFDEKTLERYSGQRIGPIRLYQCSVCGFGVYRPIVFGDSGFYSAIGQLDYYNAEKWEFDRSIAFVQSEKAHTVIDVGCGSGFFLNKLRATIPSIKVIGIEINEAAAAKARSQGHQVEIADWQSEAFQADDLPRADVVVCHQVLEHVDDPLRLLRMVRSMSKHSGLAIVSTPDSEGLVGADIGALTELPPHHVTKWNERAFRAALPRFGFSVLDIEYEPLPQNLWSGYFPAVWKSNKWPALLGRAAARLANLHGEGMNWVADNFARKGIKYVYGVGGHTIFVVARAVE